MFLYTISSYWKVFRIVFVLFFLYLLGDVFYRWDGFKFYASFSEFSPSISLVTLLWGLLSAIIAFILWVPIGAIEWFWRYKKINFLPPLFFLHAIYSFLLVAIIAFGIKNIFWLGVTVTFAAKLLTLLIVGAVTVIITLVIRSRPGIINDRITPLVWIFGIWTLLSAIIVAYQFIGAPHGVKNEIYKSTESSMASKNSPNVILVTFDALRTMDMSAYDYYRDTTPFISRWGGSASVFSKLQAESTYTTPTTASLMTGKRVWTHWTLHNSGSRPVHSYNESLPSLLRKNGYYTSAFIGTEPANVMQLGIAHDFDFAPFSSDFITPRSMQGYINKLLYKLFADKFRLYDWVLKKDFAFYQILKQISRKVMKTEHPTYDIFKRFLMNADDYKEEPFFAWIHLHPPHDPYLPPEPYMGMFDTSMELRTRDSQGALLDGRGLVSIDEATQEVVDILKARYDENIRYCDDQFKNFIQELSTRDLLKNTVVILSSDHGESFEHDVLAHGCLELFEGVTNIPLFIKLPGETDGRVIDNVVEQVDIPATILDIAGIPVPSWMDGRSLMPLINDGDFPVRPAFSMALFNNKVGEQISKGTVAVWEGDYKLIYYIEENRAMLFNMKNDPDELVNLFDKEQEAGQYLLSLIKENLELANKRIRSKGQ